MNNVENPLVSVVIPTYNHAHYLDRALKSVLVQTYPNWEVIVVDNHSNDNTDEVIVGFVDPRITCLKIHNNGVIAASRNAGIRVAKGEWIALLDSDDWWTANKLQACLECIDEKVDLVYHDLEIVTDQPRYLRRNTIDSWQVNTPVLIDLLVRGNALATSSVLVRKKILEQLNGMKENPDMVAMEDYNTWLRIAQLTEKFRYVSKRLGFYQLHNQGISSRVDMSVPAQHAVVGFIDLLSMEQKNKYEANICYKRGRFNYLGGSYKAAKCDLLFALRYGKLSLKPKLIWMLFMIGMVH